MNKLFRTALAVSIQLSAVSFASADTFHLANGNTIEGIVLSETPDKLEIQFAAGGSITFGRDEIASIDPADDKTRDSLKKKWTEDKEAFQKEWVAQQELKAKQPPPKEAPEPVERVVVVERVIERAADAPKSEPLDLSKPVAPGYVVSYPFWNWKGEPEYRTFPVVYNRVPRRRRDRTPPEKRERPPQSLHMEAATRAYNHLGTTSFGR